MERYRYLATVMKDRATGKQRYATFNYPKVPYSDSDIYIFAKRSDKLDMLAYKYYGDQTYWWVIARANDLGKGIFSVPPGKRLRIPFPISELVFDEILRNQ